MKKKFFLIAITLIIIGGIGTYINRDQYFTTTSETLDKMKPIYTKQFSVDKINNLAVNLQTEILEVRTANINHIQVDVKTIKPKTDDLPLRISEENDELNIKSTEKDERTITLVKLKTRTKVIVTIPLKKKLENCIIATTVGRLIMNDLECKTIKATTEVGLIELSDLTTDSLLTKSQVGMIELTNIMGKIEAKTEVGQISLSTLDLKSNIDLKSEIGAIDVLFVDKPVQTRINARSKFGEISIFDKNVDYYGEETEPYKLTVETEVGPIQVERE